MKLITCNANRPLAEAIADHLDCPLSKAEIKNFADDEIFGSTSTMAALLDLCRSFYEQVLVAMHADSSFLPEVIEKFKS